MTCPRCHAGMVEINLSLGQHAVVMRSCSSCGTRTWQDEGRPAGLPTVLRLAAMTRR